MPPFHAGFLVRLNNKKTICTRPAHEKNKDKGRFDTREDFRMDYYNDTLTRNKSMHPLQPEQPVDIAVAAEIQRTVRPDRHTRRTSPALAIG